MSLSPIPKRVVVAFPQIESSVDWAQILAVRERFDPLAGAIAPHLTLVFPFEDPISDRVLSEHLQRTVADEKAFHITFRGITAHEDEYLFLNVKRGNDPLIRLHDLLYTQAFATHRKRTHTFVPHVTVGRLSSKSLFSALDATSGLTSAIEATVDTISVYRIERDGTRPIVYKQPLRAPAV